MRIGDVTVEQEEQTIRLAQLLARSLTPPLTICLDGSLGAGKTFFTRAFAAALGIPAQEVVSPTFALCQTYAGDERIHHIDAYRIGSTAEFEGLGPDDWFEDDAFTLIEWSEKVTAALPPARITIEIAPLDIERRRFRLEWTGSEVPDWLPPLEVGIRQFS